jgi:chaperone BCS1
MREMLQVVEITPADVAECLMVSKRTDPGTDACLGRLIDELKKKAAEKETKNSEEEEEVAAPVDAKPNDTCTSGRRVIDAKSIRRVKKVANKEEEEVGGDDMATAKPSGTEAMANGGTKSCKRANDVCLDLSDDDSSKLVAAGGTVDANDYGDGNDDDYTLYRRQ